MTPKQAAIEHFYDFKLIAIAIAACTKLFCRCFIFAQKPPISKRFLLKIDAEKKAEQQIVSFVVAPALAVWNSFLSRPGRFNIRLGNTLYCLLSRLPTDLIETFFFLQIQLCAVFEQVHVFFDRILSSFLRQK